MQVTARLGASDAPAGESLWLPRELIRVTVHHGLGGVEAMLLLHLIARRTAEGIDDGFKSELRQREASQALGVCDGAIDAAADRLAARGLVCLTVWEGRKEIDLSGLNFEVGGLWPEPGSPGTVEVPFHAIRNLIASASRGRDSVCLLLLLTELPATGAIVPSTTERLASALGITVRALQRVVARLVKQGLLLRVAGGFDLEPLMRPGAGATAAPMDGRYRALVAELMSRGRRGIHGQ